MSWEEEATRREEDSLEKELFPRERHCTIQELREFSSENLSNLFRTALKSGANWTLLLLLLCWEAGQSNFHFDNEEQYKKACDYMMSQLQKDNYSAFEMWKRLQTLFEHFNYFDPIEEKQILTSAELIYTTIDRCLIEDYLHPDIRGKWFSCCACLSLPADEQKFRQFQTLFEELFEEWDMFEHLKLDSIIRCDGDMCELFFSGPTVAYELAILQRKYFYSKFKDIFNKYKFRRFTVLRESEKVLLCVYFHSYMPDYLGDTVDYGTISQAQYNIAKSESDQFLASGDDDMDDIGEAFKHMSIDGQ